MYNIVFYNAKLSWLETKKNRVGPSILPSRYRISGEMSSFEIRWTMAGPELDAPVTVCPVHVYSKNFKLSTILVVWGKLNMSFYFKKLKDTLYSLFFQLSWLERKK